MKHVSSIAALALASGLVLLTTGCDRKPDEQAANAVSPTPGERVDNAIDTTKQETRELGNSLEQKANQAGQAIDDASITTSIKGKYLTDDTLKGSDISVDTDHGVVKLTGTVQSDSDKELATKIAQSVEGVVSVNNQLAVK